MSVKKVPIVLSVATAVLGAACIGTYMMYRDEVTKNQLLEQQLHELSEKEKRSVIVQHISAQLEEIASEQKIISDEQRQAAEEQTLLANEERQRAEIALQNAMAAERAASESEQRAVDASKIADRQRSLAEQGQREADYARSVADTLSYLSLARSLGSQAITQQNTGNTELATLLAYASYVYTIRYGGDAYLPAIYDALSLTSKSSTKYSVGKGAITNMTWFNDTEFMTVSTYGEIKDIKITGDKLSSTNIVNDPQYDFRDLFIDRTDNSFYAVSHTNHLIVGKKDSRQVKVVRLETVERPFRIFQWNPQQILVTGEQSMCVVDTKTLNVVKTIHLDFKTSVAGEEGSQVVLFDEQGKMYYVNKNSDIITPKAIPDQKTIASYVFNEQSKKSVFGTKDGIIYLKDRVGHITKLIGHRSRVSQVKFDAANDRLYSSSFDGTVRFWNINSEKIEPMNVLNSGKWVVCISFDNTNNYIWTGDQNGVLTKTLISVPLLAERVKSRLTRDFTQEEWAYYIGNKIRKESFVNQ